jgi:hypothetical protein
MLLTKKVREDWVSLYPIVSIRTLMFSTGQIQIRYETKRGWSLGYLMTHYVMEQWVDFSRNLGDGEERARMHGHLATGCGECTRLLAVTTKLVATCGQLNAIEVPEYAMRMARAIFPLRMPERPKRGNRLPIELIFDSFLVPATAGLRSTWQVGWQGLYRTAECSVDLRIEPELKSPRAAVIGQITNHVQPTEAMSDLPVSLRAGKLVVAETLSNRFGEFQMEYEQQSQLKLCIHLRDSKLIQVPLKKLTADQPAAKSRASRRKR